MLKKNIKEIRLEMVKMDLIVDVYQKKDKKNNLVIEELIMEKILAMPLKNSQTKSKDLGTYRECEKLSNKTCEMKTEFERKLS